MYVYIRSEPNLYTVGFYDPTGEWHSDSDHEDREDAAKRVHYLNGGQDEGFEAPLVHPEDNPPPPGRPYPYNLGW